MEEKRKSIVLLYNSLNTFLSLCQIYKNKLTNEDYDIPSVIQQLKFQEFQ